VNVKDYPILQISKQKFLPPYHCCKSQLLPLPFFIFLFPTQSININLLLKIFTASNSAHFKPIFLFYSFPTAPFPVAIDWNHFPIILIFLWCWLFQQFIIIYINPMHKKTERANYALASSSISDIPLSIEKRELQVVNKN
jgi:hypothetical protein